MLFLDQSSLKALTMNTSVTTSVNIPSAVSQLASQRILVVLHPNPDFITIALNDRRFNNERYGFSRKKAAEGDEANLLWYIELNIVGVSKVETQRNEMRLELSEGTLPHEVVPQVVTAIREWARKIELDYNPTVYADDRRYGVSPKYDENGWTVVEGIRYPRGQLYLGIPYIVWNPAVGGE